MSVKGRISKKSQALIERVDRKYPGWSPVLFLCQIAKTGKIGSVKFSPTDRVNAAKAAAPYIHPKLSSLTIDQGTLDKAEIHLHLKRENNDAD